jgi:hypothetical protein
MAEGEKSAVQFNDPKQIEVVKQLIDGAFQGKLGIPGEQGLVARLAKT